MKRVRVDDIVVSVDDHQSNSLLANFVDRWPVCAGSASASVHLSAEQGIHLSWDNNGHKLRYFIDIEKFTLQERSFPSAKQGALNQALGKKTKSVLDATGGWGSDALRMCSQAYIVTLVERNAIMALLLKDAMCRLSRTEWVSKNSICVPEVVEADATYYLASTKKHYDCIYLDPMFPPKRKKSAAANKNMQFLQWLLNQDHDSAQLAKTAYLTGTRVVVKRPEYAPSLIAEPQQRFSSKLVNYDVYLP